MDISTDGWTDRPEFQSIRSSLGDDLKTEISYSSSSEVPDSPHNTTTVLRPFFRDTPGEPVPEVDFMVKGRLTEAETLTIRLGTTPSGLSSAHLHYPPFFYRLDALPSAHPTVSKH